MGNYLADCFRDETPPRVSELASILEMRPSQFTRYFQRIYGENPLAVLKRAQVLHADRLLRDGFSVNDAAYRSGFGTRRSIYRTFRRVFGTTPRGRAGRKRPQ